jgi:hypothetical protein
VDDEWKCSNDFSTATDPDGNLVNYLEVHEDDDCNSIEKESLDSSGTRNHPHLFKKKVINLFNDILIKILYIFSCI